jgi:hypothetical protein
MPMSDDGITLRGTSFTVSASEKVSTGQYENYNPHLSIKGEIPEEELTDENREDLKRQLLGLHGDLHAVLQKATGNRHAEPEWENWTFGDDGPEVKSADEIDATADGGQNDG